MATKVGIKSGRYARECVSLIAYYIATQLKQVHAATNVTRFARRGLIHAPLQCTDFAITQWLHQCTSHACVYDYQQFISLLFPGLLS